MASKLIVCSVFIIIFSYFMNAQSTEDSSITLNEQSQQFLRNIKAGKSTSDFRNQLAKTSLEALDQNLKTDSEKLAFWVNIYNGYIQVILKENPKMYDDRGSFFKKKQIPVAGDTISFEKIEHGIIRKSQWPLGLGLIRKWFPNKLERKLRVNKRDYRIHFALNCGAISCPPVAIYNSEKLNEQFNKGTEKYLNSTSNYNKDTKVVIVTPLFIWFRGDFGFKKGVKNILKELEVIPITKNIKIVYKNYDWTLELDHWTDL